MTAKYADAALGEAPVTWSYPDEFTMTSSRGSITTTQHYDPNRGWLNSVEASNGTLNFDHNAYGQMKALNVVSGGTTRSTNYGYDELSRLSKITSYDGGAWNYAYDEVGNKASLSRPNGVTTTYGYDTLNRLTDLTNAKGATTLSRFNYRLRADGRRDQLNETIAQPDGTSVTRAIQYSFDDANRLTAESGTDGSGKSYSKTYTLDEAGNRQKLISVLDSSTTTTNYSYNDLDWMTGQSVVAPTSTTTTNYDYDANGSQTGITTQVGAQAASYVKQVWDSEGHMTARGAVDSAGNWGSSRNEYSYDAGGMRLSQSTVAQGGVVSAKTSYLWNGDRLLEERDKDNVLLARYEHGQELGPLSMLRPATSTVAAQTRYFIGDGQDSTRQLLDETGAIKDSYFYDAFGVNLGGNQGTSANGFKYTGQQQDDSGLYYLRARYYEPGSGRFLSHDPEMGSSDDPISMHRYLYASADSVNGIDPSGRNDISLFGITNVMAINTIVGGVTCSAMSAIDTAISGGSWWDVTKSAGAGFVVGASVGRISKVAAFVKILWGLGVIGQGTAIYDAYTQHNLNLLFFRIAAAAAPIVAKQVLNFRATTLAQREGSSFEVWDGDGTRETESYNPTIEDSHDSVRADYGGDSRAGIQYERIDGGIELSEYYKAGYTAKGAGSEMLAEVMLRSGDHPKTVKVVAIENKETLATITNGGDASETLLAKSVSKAIDYTGGKCVNWRASQVQFGDWEIKCDVQYREVP